jgi:hypothetical protein
VRIVESSWRDGGGRDHGSATKVPSHSDHLFGSSLREFGQKIFFPALAMSWHSDRLGFYGEFLRGGDVDRIARVGPSL